MKRLALLLLLLAPASASAATDTKTSIDPTGLSITQTGTMVQVAAGTADASLIAKIQNRDLQLSCVDNQTSTGSASSFFWRPTQAVGVSEFPTDTQFDYCSLVDLRPFTVVAKVWFDQDLAKAQIDKINEYKQTAKLMEASEFAQTRLAGIGFVGGIPSDKNSVRDEHTVAAYLRSELAGRFVVASKASRAKSSIAVLEQTTKAKLVLATRLDATHVLVSTVTADSIETSLKAL